MKHLNVPSSKPSKIEIDSIINLFSNGDLEKCLETIAILIKDYPEESLLFNIQGACYAALGQSDNSVKSYKTAITLKPDYAKAHYNLGGILHEIGNLDKSVHSYESALSIEPDYAEAHNNLGNVFRDLGNLDEAAKSFEKALTINQDYIEARYSLAIVLQKLGDLDSIDHFEKVLDMKPDFAEAHNNLGVALKDIGQVNEAVESYNKALKINPNYAQALNNLGNALRDLGKFEDAKEAYERALRINADYPTLHNNLGNVLRELGRLEEAIESYQTAIQISPNYQETHNNLGIALFDLGRLEDAKKSYQNALDIDPEFAETHNNIGTVYKDLGQIEKAINSYEKALEIRPNYADAYNNLGVVLKKIGRLDDAVKSYQYALNINPNDADTLNNLGNILSELEILNESVESFEKAIQLSPNFAEAHNNLSVALMKLNQLDEAYKFNKIGLTLKKDFVEGYITQGRILSMQNDLERALLSFERAHQIKPDIEFNLGSILQTKMRMCDWSNLKNLLNELIIKINNNEKAILPMDLLSLIDDPELQFKSSRIFANFEYPSSDILPKLEKYRNHSRIKIGYFSADFKDHPVANLTAELYELHDRNQFEIHAFSFGPDTNDAMNLRIKKGVDYFHEVSQMSDKEIALLSRSVEIDIAIDLSGYTEGCRTKIFSMSAAPIQASYIGLLSSMGSDYYDYIIAGEGMIPEQNQKYFSEKIIYLPSYQVNDSKELPPDIEISRAELNLPENSFVFCCFNNTYKITPAIFDSWARILKRVENSVLMVYVNNETSQNNLIKEIDKRNVDTSRLFFGGNLSRQKYLARYRVADLFLDTSPYNAGTTASDALRMGLPVLTLEGNSFNSKEASGVIRSLNLSELITNSQEEYESVAIELAKNPGKLRDLKDKLSINLTSAPLYDTELFTKNLESALKEIYARYQNDLKTEYIYVSK